MLAFALLWSIVASIRIIGRNTRSGLMSEMLKPPAARDRLLLAQRPSTTRWIRSDSQCQFSVIQGKNYLPKLWQTGKQPKKPIGLPVIKPAGRGHGNLDKNYTFLTASPNY